MNILQREEFCRVEILKGDLKRGNPTLDSITSNFKSSIVTPVKYTPIKIIRIQVGLGTRFGQPTLRYQTHTRWYHHFFTFSFHLPPIPRDTTLILSTWPLCVIPRVTLFSLSVSHSHSQSLGAVWLAIIYTFKHKHKKKSSR